MYPTQDIVCFAGFVELMMPYTDNRLDKEEPDDDCSKDNVALRVIVNLVEERNISHGSCVGHTALGARATTKRNKPRKRSGPISKL